MSIFGAIIAFTIIVLMCPVFEFFQISDRADKIEDNMNASLRDTCVADSIVRYDNVKHNGSSVYFIESDKYIDIIMTNLGYVNDGEKWVKDKNIIKDVNLVYDDEKSSFILTYNLSLPFKILGAKINDTQTAKSAIVQFELV